MGDIYTLDTPESVAVGYAVAGIGSRFLAILIDSVIQGGVLFALGVILALAGVNLAGLSAFVIVALGILIINVVLLGYFIFFEIIWNGQTPGKRAMKLRVIKTSGYPVTPFAVLVRNVMRIADILPSLYAAGVITMIANRQSRRLGDLVAGTLVIKEGRDGSLASISAPSSPIGTPYAPRTPTQPPPPGWSGSTTTQPFPPGWSGSTATPLYAPPRWSGAQTPNGSGPMPGLTPLLVGAQVERLTREDEALIRDFLSRRATLPAQRRNDLARQIAAVVHNRIGGDGPPYGDARATIEPYLELVLAVRRTSGGQ